MECCFPKGFATLSRSAMPEATSGLGRSKLRTPIPQRKIDVKRELSVDSVSVFTLIRTDTTLDHSQKAEKICADMHAGTDAQFALVKASVHHRRHFEAGRRRMHARRAAWCRAMQWRRDGGRKYFFTWCTLLVVARKQTTSREILLWMIPSEAPKALQASECSELLDPMRASSYE